MFIEEITIQNIKGIKKQTFKFDDLCSNKVNLFVAPNGSGKTTLTLAFEAAAHGSMKLNKRDYYGGVESNKPVLSIKYKDNSGIKNSVETSIAKGEISKKFSIFVIKSPVFAKATGRNTYAFVTHTAELYIKNAEICDVPSRYDLSYRYSDYKSAIGKSTINLSDYFKSEEGLNFIITNKNNISKCLNQKRIEQLIDSVNAGRNTIKVLKENSILNELLNELEKQFKLNEVEAFQYLNQIIMFVGRNRMQAIQQALVYIEYKRKRKLIDQRLYEFNTTGLNLKTVERNNRLIIEFGNANRLSNGERDILTFVVNLAVVEAALKNKPGILVIDEVFDYLDGSNLLAAQYYLSVLIRSIHDVGKIIFPIIMTHLDPVVFSNYYFKKMKVHYLTNKSKIDLNDNLVKLLVLRSKLHRAGDKKDADDLEKYLLHYYTETWIIPETLLTQLPDGFWKNNIQLREYLYKEVTDKYLADLDYNALAVILALRIKVEELTLNLIDEDKKDAYFDQHGSNKKLQYAEESGCDLPEVFYLLQPLYNDPIHLSDNAKDLKMNKNKIESAYLKVATVTVNKMISELFRK